MPLRGGWSARAPGAGFLDLGYDADDIGAEDGADSRGVVGLGDSGWVAFVERDSEEDLARYV